MKKSKNRRKTNKNKKRSTKKRSTKKRSAIKRSTIKAGKYLGKGTFGKFYADPRLPCEDETISDVLDLNEGSKIFVFDSEANTEWNDYETNIRNSIPENLLNEMKEFFLLPIKKCKINKQSIKEEPYINPDWKKSPKGKFDTDIFTESGIDLPDISDKFNEMIIYEKANENIQNYFDRNTSLLSMYNMLNLLVYPLKGIEILQHNNLIHGDIKMENMVLYENRIVIIDNNTIRDMRTTTNMIGYPQGYMYFAWPSTNMFTVYFSNDNARTIEYIRNHMISNYGENYNVPTDLRNIHLTRNLKYTLLNVLPDFSKKNIRSISEVIFPERDYVFLLENDGKIQQDIVRQINQRKNKLLNQKLLTPTADQLNLYNTYPSKFTNVEEFKLDILKRIDLYSFGVMLAQIFTKIIRLHNYLRIPISDTLLGIYGGFYEYIIYNFCYQGEKVIDINVLIVTYWDMLDELNKHINATTTAASTAAATTETATTETNVKRRRDDEEVLESKIPRI